MFTFFRGRGVLLTTIGFLAGFLIPPVQGQTLDMQHERYRYRAVLVESPPIVDGDLSDPAWQGVEVIDQLTQQIPNYGQPATEKTEVRIIYDSTALYIGVYCYESDPARAVRNILRYRDDNLWGKDDVMLFGIDTFHDHRRSYVFTTNALGTKHDSQIDNDAWHNDWNEVWDVRTRLHEDGWSAELRIPFRILRFPAGGGGVWGFNFERRIRSNNEMSFWVPNPPAIKLTRPAFYGHLEGLVGIQPQRNLQFIPYGLWSGTWSGEEKGSTSSVEGGGDVKLTITSGSTLDLTYNTNFSQVEADDQQINLTRLSLFFPEKREFFLENAELFSFGVAQEAQLFFSRRIGLAGGEAVPILGGARLSGRTGPFDLGLLTTQTESHLNIPSTNFSTARVRWHMGRRSSLGGIFTSVSSKTQGNRVFGPDVLLWLGRYLRVEGFAAMVDDRALHTHPISYSTALIYNEDLWEINLRTLRVDKAFQPALGFIRREGGYDSQQAKLRRGWRLNRGWARKVDFSGQLTYINDARGELDTRQWLLDATDELDSGDRINFQLQRNFERLGPEEKPFVVNPRQGIVIPLGDYSFNRWLIGYTGFPGKAWVGNVKLEGGEYYSGKRTALTLSGTWRPSPHLDMTIDYEYNNISLPQADFATHLWRGRFTVPFTPRITVDGFLQWNSLAQQFDTQLRFHLIYAQESNLYVVFTDQGRYQGGGVVERDQALQVKATYRFYR